MLFFACILLGSLAATVHAQWQHTSSVDFLSILDSNDLTLAAFVAPWTPPCESLASEWEAAKSQLSQPLISIDCTTESSLCAAHNVHSYPAIRLFRGGSELSNRYRGPRKASAIVPFVKRASLPAVSTVNVKNLTDLLAVDRVTFVAYLSEDDHVTRSQFTKVAGALHDQFVFGITTDENLAEQENVGQLPSIVAYKTDVGDRETLHGGGTAKRSVIEKFVVEAGRPLIDELTRRTEMSYMSSHKLIAYIFVSNDEHRTSLRRELYPIAKTYKDYVNFVTIDSDDYGHMAASLGISGNDYPAFTVYSAWKDQVFPFPQTQPIKVETAEPFLLEILQGQKEPWKPEESRGGHHDEL